MSIPGGRYPQRYRGRIVNSHPVILRQTTHPHGQPPTYRTLPQSSVLSPTFLHHRPVRPVYEQGASPYSPRQPTPGSTKVIHGDTGVKLEQLSERIEALASQADSQRSSISALESQLAIAQMAATTREADREDVDERHRSVNNHQISLRLEEECRKLSSDVRKYQLKCEAYKRSKTHLESRLETAVRERRNLAFDLEDCRRYATSVEETKFRIEEELQDNISESNKQKEKAEALEKQLNGVKLDLSNEQQKACKLQECLSTAQEALVSQELELKKRVKELAVVLDHLEVSEKKRGELVTEVERLRSKNGELEEEAKQLRSSVKPESSVLTPSQTRKMGDTLSTRRRSTSTCLHSPSCSNHSALTHDPRLCRSSCSHSFECRSSRLARNRNTFNSAPSEDEETPEIQNLKQVSNTETRSIMELINSLDRWRIDDK